MILKVPNDCGCTVYDANGVQLKNATWCDTETGEAVHIVFKDPGRVELMVNDDGQQVVKTEWRQHPAPLTFVRHRAEVT